MKIRGFISPYFFVLFVETKIMIELLKQLISVNIDLNGITFYGKWLLVLPLFVVNIWIWFRGVKSFFGTKKIKIER